MNYLSVCSGIEAATVAWHPLGWEPVAFSEIEAFPAAVLRRHYPHVPNWGDMTKFKEWPDAIVDVLVGGTPCQSFSVAGLRKGLADPRGNLMLVFGAIANRYRPEWVVWENVPGVLSSNGGRDFGTFLGMLGELGYGFAYRVLDAQYFGLAQRRKRVFVVGCLGDWRRAAAVLFERASLSGHPAPSRKAREIAPTIPARSAAGGGLGTDFDCDGGLILSHDPTCTLTAREYKEALPEAYLSTVAHSLRGEGFDASEDGTGRGTPIVPVPFDTTQITSAANRSNPKPGDPCHPLAAGAHPPAIAFNARQDPDHWLDRTGPLDCDGSTQAVAFNLSGSSKRDFYLKQSELSMCLGTKSAEPSETTQNSITAIVANSAVRRLTPRECERLQGFPDHYTAIPWRGKPADQCPDGPRYKALGNSMAVPVMRWIGRRIQMVVDLESLAGFRQNGVADGTRTRGNRNHNP